MKLVILNFNKNKFQIPILKQAGKLEFENLKFNFFNQLIHWNLEFKILRFTIVFCLLCYCFAGCDTIYNKESKPLVIKADTALSRCLRVEGVLAVFPSVKKVYINTPNSKVLENEILVLIFHDKKELLAFKNKISRESDKSIETVKSKIDTQKENYVIVPATNTIPCVLPLNNITVFQEGLWIVFYSETPQSIEAFLEFKRIGVNEIPETSIIPI